MIKKIIALMAILIGLGFMLIPYDMLLLDAQKDDATISQENQGDDMKKKPMFVIQKHNASHLHYDLRLEINNTLKSWALPKGPSTDPQDKRLAVETEDHPLEYAHFEGIIPENEYGAGSVIIWDKGHFDNIKTKDDKPVPLKKCYEDGHIEVNLHGKKLHGEYALIRTKSDDLKKWLFIKMRDEYADARKNPVNTQPESVVSGLTIQELESKKKLKK